MNLQNKTDGGAAMPLAPKQTKQKKQSPALVIAKREVSSYFGSAVSAIVTVLFLCVAGVLVFSMFFLGNRADLRYYFNLLPLLLSFFVPAMTMRLFAEEKRSMSIESLMTLPVSDAEIAAGKFIAAAVSCAAMIAPTLLYVITLFMFGSPDAGPLAGGFLGALLLCLMFASIGTFASSLTKNQIVAFFAAFIISIALTMVDSFLVFFPGGIVSFFSFISANNHFAAISKGVIDTRDVLYFLSVTAIFFCLTVRQVERSRL